MSSFQLQIFLKVSQDFDTGIEISEFLCSQYCSWVIYFGGCYNSENLAPRIIVICGINNRHGLILLRPWIYWQLPWHVKSVLEFFVCKFDLHRIQSRSVINVIFCKHCNISITQRVWKEWPLFAVPNWHKILWASCLNFKIIDYAIDKLWIVQFFPPKTLEEFNKFLILYRFCIFILEISLDFFSLNPSVSSNTTTHLELIY